MSDSMTRISGCRVCDHLYTNYVTAPLDLRALMRSDYIEHIRDCPMCAPRLAELAAHSSANAWQYDDAVLDEFDQARAEQAARETASAQETTTSQEA